MAHLSSFAGRNPERIENVKIKMSLNKEQSESCEKDIQLLIKCKPPAMTKKDTLDVTYNFKVEYFDCVEQLKAVRRICMTPGVVMGIDVDELHHGEILIEECLREVQRIRAFVGGTWR